jgi:Domain of unknown function (DUF3883)
MEDAKAQALVKQNEVVQGEVELSLSSSEQTRLNELENLIRESQAAIEKESFIIGRALLEIQKSRLYRATHKTFDDYVTEKFAIARVYAIQLANISGYHQLAVEGLHSGESFQMSVNTAIAFDIEVRKIARELGVDKNEIQSQLQSIIKLSLRLLCDIGLNKDNNIILTPRITKNFFATLKDFVKPSTIEIDGEQLTVEEAKRISFPKRLIQSKFLEAAEENIWDKQVIIKSEAINKNADKSTSLNIEYEEFEEDDSEGKKDTEIAEVRVAEYLRAMENVANVQTVGTKNAGYDLEVIFNNGRKIYVEVKSVKSFSERFRLTTREYTKAHFYNNDYYIAVIINTEKAKIKFISNPLNKMKPEEVIQTIFYQFNKYSNHFEDEI